MRRYLCLLLLCFLASAPTARAVIVMGSQGRNTSAPTGSLSSAGWQYEGNFGPFLATPIASDYFITAHHIGGTTATPFVFNGTTYTIDSTFNGGTGVVNIPGTDLNVWKITGTFPTFAPLYGGGSLTFGSEVGKSLFVTGRGTQRGEPLTLADARLQSGDGTTSLPQAAALPASLVDGGATDQKGWFVGPVDGVQSWGTNAVSSTLTYPTLGNFLYYTFDQGAGSNEGILSPNDSGGGLFIDATGTGDWRLAGINYGVDGPFQGTASGSSFFAALYDAGGLWEAGSTPLYIADQSTNIPAGSYDSAISANYTAIESIISSGADVPSALPEPGCVGILLIGIVTMRRTRAGR